MSKGLNRFTGLERTPPALAHCMRQKQRKLGELDRLKADAQALKERISVVEAQINALDVVIGLHPVKIDPRKIPPVRRKQKSILPHGQSVKLILSVLRYAREPLTTREIALSIAQAQELETTPDLINRLRISCVKNLNYLHDRGAVERHHAKRTNGDGFWSRPCENSM